MNAAAAAPRARPSPRACAMPHTPSPPRASAASAPPRQPPQQHVAARRQRKRQARKRARDASRARKQPNTSIYVTGLPADVTREQLAAFCAKCGILMPDARTGLPRVKIYRDELGRAKGDALVTYALQPSVQNAIQLLDGACFRDAQFALSVSEATFDHKRARTDADAAAAAARRDAPRLSRHLFVREKMSWDDHEQRQQRRGAPNASRIVILKNVFDARTADYQLIRDDMQQGCAECGEVEKVTVFERNAEGAVAVRFASIQSCLQCIQRMNGRWYDGRQLSAHFYDGHSDYRYKESAADRHERDRKWQQWLQHDDTQAADNSNVE